MVSQRGHHRAPVRRGIDPPPESPEVRGIWDEEVADRRRNGGEVEQGGGALDWEVLRRPRVDHRPVNRINIGTVWSMILVLSHGDHRSMYSRSRSAFSSNSRYERERIWARPVIPGLTVSRRRCQRP